MSQGLPNKHTRDRGAWHFCARCGNRAPLAEMRWQRGLLLDQKCVDAYPLLGQYDKAVADALSNIIASPDLQPDPKLIQPDTFTLDDDIFI